MAAVHDVACWPAPCWCPSWQAHCWRSRPTGEPCPLPLQDGRPGIPAGAVHRLLLQRHHASHLQGWSAGVLLGGVHSRGCGLRLGGGCTRVACVAATCCSAAPLVCAQVHVSKWQRKLEQTFYGSGLAYDRALNRWANQQLAPNSAPPAVGPSNAWARRDLPAVCIHHG